MALSHSQLKELLFVALINQHNERNRSHAVALLKDELSTDEILFIEEFMKIAVKKLAEEIYAQYQNRLLPF